MQRCSVSNVLCFSCALFRYTSLYFESLGREEEVGKCELGHTKNKCFLAMNAQESFMFVEICVKLTSTKSIRKP